MLRFLTICLLLAVVALGTWLGWGLWLPARPAQEQILLLRAGWSTRHIVAELQRAGIVRSPNAFLLYHYLTHPQTLKAGEYKFDRAANAMQVHARLVQGDVFKHTVVIPEGFNMFDVAGAVEKAGLGSKEDFLAIARQQTVLISDIDPNAKSLEGYLFPDTYQFMRTQSLTDIASVMVRRFRQEARSIGLLPASGEVSQDHLPAGMDLHQLVTLASIVEKETGTAEERPLVAGVYYNRLAKKIALDADPSVIYAALLAGHYDGTIYRSDLEAASPYNTYKHSGLPPGPIANPGRASLQAALSPASTAYYYFVSDANGHHRFARSLDEHSRNVALYRRARAGENR
jgi:UPF0755 protein